MYSEEIFTQRVSHASVPIQHPVRQIPRQERIIQNISYMCCGVNINVLIALHSLHISMNMYRLYFINLTLSLMAFINPMYGK